MKKKSFLLQDNSIAIFSNFISLCVYGVVRYFLLHHCNSAWKGDSSATKSQFLTPFSSQTISGNLLSPFDQQLTCAITYIGSIYYKRSVDMCYCHFFSLKNIRGYYIEAGGMYVLLRYMKYVFLVLNSRKKL